MAQGLLFRNHLGNVVFDSTTITGRIIGSRIISTVPYMEAIVLNPPPTAGKRLWWHYAIGGNLTALVHSVTANGFTIQVDGTPNSGPPSGEVYLRWGECKA